MLHSGITGRSADTKWILTYLLAHLQHDGGGEINIEERRILDHDYICMALK